MSFELVGVKLVAEDYNQYMQQVGSADKATAGFGDQSSATFKQMPGLADIAVGAFHKIGEVAVDSFLKAGKAAAGFFKDSIGVAGNFEAGMADFKVAVGDSLDATGLKLDNFRQDFLDIGKELPVSTSEVQQAAVDLIKGGIDPLALHAGALKESIQFAAAAGVDLSEAADLSARQLGIWVDAAASGTEQAQFLAKSHELLVKAAGASTVGVDDLAKAMNVAGGQAKALNLDYQDFTTAMAELAPAFNSTEEAGTSFKNFLARIQPTTKPAIGAMEALGLYSEKTGSAFFDAKGKFVGVRKAADLLQKSTQGLTDAQRASLLQTIFGNDAMGTAVRLAMTGAAGYDAMAAKIDKASGVTAAAAEKQKGWNTALDNAKGSLETLQITLGTKVLPVLTDFFNKTVAPGINIITDLVDKGHIADKTFKDLTPTMQTVGRIFEGAFQGAQHAFTTVQGLIDRVIKDIAIWRSGVVSGKTILESFGLSPQVAGIIDTIVTKISGFTQYLGDVKTKVANAFQFDGISGAIGALAGELLKGLDTLKGQLFSWVTGAIPGWSEQLKGFIAPTAQWVLDAIPTVLTNLAEMRGKLFAWITASLPDWLTTFGQLAKPAGQWVLDAIPGLLDNLGTFAQRMIDQTLTYVPQWGATLVQFGVKAVSWIGDALPGLADNLGAFFNRMANWVVDSLPKWEKNLEEFGGKAAQWVLDALPGLGTNLGTMAGKLIAWTIQTTVDVTPKLAMLGAKFVGWVVTDVLPALPGALLKIGTGIFNFIVGLGEQVVPKLAELGTKFVTWVDTSVLPKLPGALDSIQTKIGEWVKGLVNWAGSELTQVGTAIVDGIWDGIRSKWGELVAWFDQKLNELKNKLPFSEPKDPTSPLRGLAKSGAAVVDMLQMGIRQAGPLEVPSVTMSVPASPMALMAGGGGSMQATYNNQRSTELHYHTTVAPAPATSLAIASAMTY